MNEIFKRGDIYLANIPKISDHVQFGEKHVVIVSNKRCNRFSSNVIVCPITSREKHNKLPTHVYVEFALPSTVLCENIITIGKERLIKFTGILSNDDMNKIDQALKISLALD